MADWPESERPVAFIHEEVNYPEGMFHVKQDTSKKKQGEAGKKVYQRFVKGKSKLNKYQHDTYLSIDSEIQYDKHTTSTWQFLLSTFAFFRKIAHFLLDRVCM